MAALARPESIKLEAPKHRQHGGFLDPDRHGGGCPWPQSKKGEFSWFLRLRRPRWLVFEGLIPVIWLVIYACFYGSALLSWNAAAQWTLLIGYLALLVLVQSYTLVICRSRSLANGTWIGFAGWVWGIALTLVVAQHSFGAWLLLLPYLIWSPVGTFVTWQMQKLNR